MNTIKNPLLCLETGEMFTNRNLAIKIHPSAKYCTQAASGKRLTAGGFHWAWCEFREFKELSEKE
jgi:hypothetical protein